MAPINWTWTYFCRGKKRYRKNKTNYEAYCRGCVTHWMENLEEADQQAVAEGESAIKCPHVVPEAKQKLAEEDAARNPPNEPSSSGPNPGSNLGGPPPPLPSISLFPPDHSIQICAPLDLTPNEAKTFQADILRLFVSNNIALRAVDSVETRIFFNKYFPGAQLPTRQALGGDILKEAVQKSEEHMVKAVYGKMATGMSDGWKDKRKRALLAYMANVDATAYTVGIEDISALPKTAENHLKVVKEAIKRCEDKLGMKIVGWVSDAGGDSRGGLWFIISDRIL
ncbi:hypothetical protein BN14_12240 [Rhizoctonia solani AG-1 IB]|uniref:DUF659 domain-containing protein n=1 Tax=Thanatephorus cucumeris (strain AG1-IB / isolate 7/3/14) TaxID=1108050 RepID=M5CF55_THACB|nr:hypothetical protein BN14_12240 [Rhizoctonia solani AG-1 IB]